MSKNVSVTPGRLTVMGARIGALVAAMFVIFGGTFAYVVLKQTGDDPDERLLIGMFFVVFLVTCVSILVMYLRIGFGKGTAQENSLIDLEVNDSDDDKDKTPKS